MSIINGIIFFLITDRSMCVRMKVRLEDVLFCRPYYEHARSCLTLWINPKGNTAHLFCQCCQRPWICHRMQKWYHGRSAGDKYRETMGRSICWLQQQVPLWQVVACIFRSMALFMTIMFHICKHVEGRDKRLTFWTLYCQMYLPWIKIVVS